MRYDDRRVWPRAAGGHYHGVRFSERDRWLVWPAGGVIQ